MDANCEQRSADVLIIGAGLAGAATAHHLGLAEAPARREAPSVHSVILLEKEALPGMHSSGRNAAFVRELMDHAAMQPLGTEGARFLQSGALAEFRRCGLMLLGKGDVEAREHFPLARGRGQWRPNEGIVDVAALLAGYLAGQDVRYETEVESWREENTFLVVRTSRGDFRCRTLVCAAGPWAGQLGGLPITPMKRHLVQTPPMPGIQPDWPFVWHAKEGLYFRPESGGLLMSPCDETPAAPGDYSESEAALESLAEKLDRLQPDLGALSVLRTWVGQRTFARDRAFVIGFDPRHPRLFHVAGLGGHGVTTSYAVGRIAAEMLIHGEPLDNPFRVGRLLPHGSNSAG